MTVPPTSFFIAIILALVLMELLVIKEQTSNGRQSKRLRVPVQIQERLPKGRRFLGRSEQKTWDANTQTSQKEKSL